MLLHCTAPYGIAGRQLELPVARFFLLFPIPIPRPLLLAVFSEYQSLRLLPFPSLPAVADQVSGFPPAHATIIPSLTSRFASSFLSDHHAPFFEFYRL
jgi:hypothetical protein